MPLGEHRDYGTDLRAILLRHCVVAIIKAGAAHRAMPPRLTIGQTADLLEIMGKLPCMR
jgi:hypothetical protein